MVFTRVYAPSCPAMSVLRLIPVTSFDSLPVGLVFIIYSKETLAKSALETRVERMRASGYSAYHTCLMAQLWPHVDPSILLALLKSSNSELELLLYHLIVLFQFRRH